MAPHQPPQEPSVEALFRYAVISQVLLRERRGEARPHAVAEVATLAHLTPEGTLRQVSRRTLYRWLAAYQARGFAGLTAPRMKRSEGGRRWSAFEPTRVPCALPPAPKT